jgi:hypothetical protein
MWVRERVEKWSTFLSDALRFLKQHRFLESSLAAPVCPSVGSNMWMKMGIQHQGENRSNRRKTCPSAGFPPQISRVLTWDRTRASAVRRQWPTASAMARPNEWVNESDTWFPQRYTLWPKTRLSIHYIIQCALSVRLRWGCRNSWTSYIYNNIAQRDGSTPRDEIKG